MAVTVPFRWAVVGSVAAGVLCAGGVTLARAQVDRRDIPIVTQPQQRFDSGQDVQPIFEGWERNDDGSLTFHFGYLNRNYREQPSIPIGPTNHFSPGESDRGQPTYFYPRTHRYQFSVWAPSHMGSAFKDGLVWTVTHNGSEQRAIGWLQPEWEIDEDTIVQNSGMGFSRPRSQRFENAPPDLIVDVTRSTVAVGDPLTVTARIDDDGLPSELPPQRPRRSRDPSLTPPVGTQATPDNISWYRRPRPPRNGLSVLWVVHRGPAAAIIDPPDFQRAISEVEREPTGTQARRYPSVGPRTTRSSSLEGDGRTSATFEATATFLKPGVYTLRAFASDAMRLTSADVAVTVTAARRPR